MRPRLDFPWFIGIEVTPSAAEINTENATVSDSKNTTDIGQLPLNFPDVFLMGPGSSFYIFQQCGAPRE